MILQLFTIHLILARYAFGDPHFSKQNSESGILISGGGQALNKWVELFVPSSGYSCLLPSLPDIREDHTMNGLYICGGDDIYARDSCIQFVSGQWTGLSYTGEHRDDHSSWLTPQGLVLMGGSYNMRSTEIITLKGGQGGPGFDLIFDVRGSCPIVDSSTDTVIITGGMSDEVARYDLLGYLEDLPSMLRIRNMHGCGSYLNSDGAQVLLVAGGFDHVNFEYLSSTELLTVGSNTWTMATPLPGIMYAMKGATLDNKIFMTGGRNRDTGEQYDLAGILEWDAAENSWKKTGQMQTARSSHAVTSIQLDQDLLQFCV